MLKTGIFFLRENRGTSQDAGVITPPHPVEAEESEGAAETGSSAPVLQDFLKSDPEK